MFIKKWEDLFIIQSFAHIKAPDYHGFPARNTFDVMIGAWNYSLV
jgi:hypothetical protein